MEKEVLEAILGSYMNIINEIQYLKGSLKNISEKVDINQSEVKSLCEYISKNFEEEKSLLSKRNSIANKNNNNDCSKEKKIISCDTNSELQNRHNWIEPPIKSPIWISNTQTTEVMIESKTCIKKHENISRKSISTKYDQRLDNKEVLNCYSSPYLPKKSNDTKKIAETGQKATIKNQEKKSTNYVKAGCFEVSPRETSFYADRYSMKNFSISSTQPISINDNTTCNNYISSTQQKKRLYKRGRIVERYFKKDDIQPYAVEGFFGVLEKEIEEMY